MDNRIINFAAEVDRTFTEMERQNIMEYALNQRYHRPSSAKPYDNPYSFEEFRKPNDIPPLITTVFHNPQDVILAFYGIIRSAANMAGYSGTCGVVGNSIVPYAYAYELFTEELQQRVTLNEFINLSSGIGHTTLLKLIPANKNYFMFEEEQIGGVEISDQDYGGGSRFLYDYGLIGVKETKEKGWKIDYFEFRYEDFLCAPYHGWFYRAEDVVNIVFRNLNIIEEIDRVEQSEDMTYVYASGHGKRYRFDFVHLTNGYDILIHENIYRNMQWVEVSLLTNEWKYLKLEKL